MKFNLMNGRVTLTSENEREALYLFSIATKTEPVIDQMPRTHRKHKKHIFIKRCELCGRGYKGAKGLATHTRRAHGISNAAIVV